jgi:hypothetical protein
LASMTDEAGDQSLVAAEEHAIAVLSIELKDHLDLTETAFNLLGRVQAAAPPLPLHQVTQARKVCATLLVRFSNDLRCTALQAVRGYAIQSAILVASMYEVAFTVATIGNQEELAQQWIDHDDPTKPFLSVPQLTVQGVDKLGLDSTTLADKHYQTYQQLCMAKHANPLFQMQHGHTVQGTEIRTQNGPDLSDQATRIAWFALENAGGLATVAAGSFLSHHVPQSERLKLAPEVTALGKRGIGLRQRAVGRWGADDPCPGRWRRIRIAAACK